MLQEKFQSKQILDLISDELSNNNASNKLKNVYYFDIFCEEVIKCLQSQSTQIDFVQEVSDYLIQAEVCTSPKSSAKFCNDLISTLTNKLTAQTGGSDEDDNDDNENELDDKDLVLDTNEQEMDGCCEMCLTQEKITLHHAIPKLMIKRLRKKKVKAPVIYIKLCGSCHARVHKTFPHAILAKKYYTIQALLDCEELADYIQNKRKYIQSKEI